MERKDLKPIEREVEVYFGTYETESVYDKAEADSVMDAIEERIKELELALENSREHSKALRKCFEGHRKQIKELEADKLRQENYCESLVNENKRLNEIIIFKDMVGAELHNENKELKQKLETRIAEALKARAGESRRSIQESKLGVDVGTGKDYTCIRRPNEKA